MGAVNNTPKHVMRLTEAVWTPKKTSKKMRAVKIAVIVILAVILLGSLFFRESLLHELSWQARILLIVLCLNVFLINGGHEKQPSAMEIWFYDDRLVVYREKFYCVLSIYHKEYNIVPYNGIKEVVFRNETKRLNILGIVEGIYYKYRKNGTLPDKPYYHKTTDSIVYFYTDFMDEARFLEEFEANCPIPVVIHNT